MTDALARYERLSATLASRGDGELTDAVHVGSSGTVGVGGDSAIIDVDGVQVFAKRIPLTAPEVAGSTALPPAH
jgi:hypothetical protein